MGGGNKKNKRGSIPSSSSGSGSGTASTSSFAKIELIERTAENDYGVMSDPEETDPSSPVPLLTKEESVEQANPSAAANSAAAPTAEPLQHSADADEAQTECARSYNSSEPQQPPHLSLHSSPSLQPLSQQQDQLSQPQISQTQASSKSLDALKLKLNKDKNFSKKITLHTVFSYIILAIEIQRASSASIARISAHEVEILVEYMIEHHSATEDVKSYLNTLVETKVIHSMIESIIEFNKDQTDALDKLFTAEEIELQEMNTRETKTEDIPVTIVSSDTTLPSNSPQTPQRCGFFKRMRCFFSGCCG